MRPCLSPCFSVLLVLVACHGRTPTSDTGTAEGDADTDADSDADTDTDTDTDTTPASPDWTPGPALPGCSPVAGDPDHVALSGVVLLPSGPVGGFVVVDRTSGTITCAGASCDTTGDTVVCTDGVISPALIDAHDHAQYDVLAPWRHADLYQNRYDWQSDGDYYDYRAAYDDMSDAYECEIVKWAELREIVGGATSIAGTAGTTACIDGIGRDLDDGVASEIPGYELSFSSSKVGYLDASDGASRQSKLASGTVDAYLDHVAEGVGGSVRDEIDHMFDIGATGPGNLFIHATDADTEQLARMSATGTGIVWSPRSNLDLYGATTNADVAMRLGVPVVLGPDWTWSGSNRVTGELACAHDWLAARRASVTDVELFAMATQDTAVLLGLQGQLGTLEAGALADVSVFAYSDHPYQAVIEAGYEDVRLVLIAGQARYGVPELVSGLEQDPARCETVTACTEDRTICVAEGDTGDAAETYSDLEAMLSDALAATSMPPDLQYAGELYPLWACGETRASCDPSEPTSSDQDGDGVGDASDDCPAAYDPDQHDQDGDGRGDVCDPCVLSPEPSCTQSPDDLDDDGVPNDSDGCPWTYDPGNPDGDGDGHPDACDPCPSVANPGDEGCPTSIHAIRDPSDPDHPADGSFVSISGVVTGANDNSFFLQDPALTEYGAVYVYGATAPVGKTATVSGTYTEYFGLSEIGDPTVSTGADASVTPIDVDACDVGTGGADAERYESMLVRVSTVSVTDANPDAPKDFNEFEVNGCLRVDDLLCPTCWADQPAVGTSWSSITGPLDYSFSNTKVVPGTSSDLVP